MTHNTRESIEKKQKVLTSTACCRACYRQRKQLTDEIIKELEQTHHQELQKAREEERERIIYVTKNIKDAFMSPLTERRWLQCIQFTDQPKPEEQSELDQPTV